MIKSYKLNGQDIFSTFSPVENLDIELELLKNSYIYQRKWYKPWTWFKKHKVYTYRVIRVKKGE